MRRQALAFPAVVTLLISACGGGDEQSQDEVASTTGAEGGPAAGAPATTIHLVVTGGEHAGTYDATSADLTCTYGFAGPGSWGNQYSVTEKAEGEFSSLQLIVPDAKDAGDGTERMLMTVGFGPLLGPAYSEHTIDAREGKGKGRGTIAVDDRGSRGKVSFKGTSADGVGLEGTIECHQVMRGEG